MPGPIIIIKAAIAMFRIPSDATRRNRLPNRRVSTTFELQVAGLRYTATFSRFADGRAGEFFTTNPRAGSRSGATAGEAGVAASLALQFVCPLNVLQKALLRDPRGNPATPLGAAIDAITGSS